MSGKFVTSRYCLSQSCFSWALQQSECSCFPQLTDPSPQTTQPEDVYILPKMLANAALHGALVQNVNLLIWARFVPYSPRLHAGTNLLPQLNIAEFEQQQCRAIASVCEPWLRERLSIAHAPPALGTTLGKPQHPALAPLILLLNHVKRDVRARSTRSLQYLRCEERCATPLQTRPTEPMTCLLVKCELIPGTHACKRCLNIDVRCG